MSASDETLALLDATRSTRSPLGIGRFQSQGFESPEIRRYGGEERSHFGFIPVASGSPELNMSVVSVIAQLMPPDICMLDLEIIVIKASHLEFLDGLTASGLSWHDL